MPDVEFLTGDGPGGNDDEVLETGPRGSVPRWVVLVGALAVAALIVTLLLRQGGGGDTPVAVPSRSAGPSTSAATENLTPNLPTSGNYALVGDDRGRKLFALSGSELFAFGLDGLPDEHGVPISVGAITDADVELILDSAAHLLWVVPQNNAVGHVASTAGAVEAFDTRTLHLLGRSALPARTGSAAALDGSLFLTTAEGLYRIPAPGASAQAVRAAGSSDALLTADPARHRLIVVQVGAHITSRFLGADGDLSAPRRLPVDGALIVVGSTIWTTGLRDGHEELAMLDPKSLEPSRNFAPTGANVAVEGAGQRSLYVYVDDRLHCLSGSSGRTLHDFGLVQGTFASADGRGYVGSISALHPVAMGRCPG